MDSSIQGFVASICNAESLPEALLKFSCAEPLLRDYKFALASESGTQLGNSANKTFSAGAVVRSIFPTKSVVVIDSLTYREMLSGSSTFQVDHSISLDTMAVSYLRPFLAGKSLARLPKDMGEVFDFIAQDNVFVDPMPYVMENLHNLGDEKNDKKILDILTAYQILRTIDADYLRSKRIVHSKLSELELGREADAHFDRMVARRADDQFYSAIEFRHKFVYSYLLKMVEIKFRMPSASVNDKMLCFLDFCHADMSCIAAREVALARAYFENGQKLTFFGKIQKNRDDLFGVLSGMAWDLYHVRQLEEAMTFKLSPSARYFFPALLTFDKRFIEIMDLYPLKAIAYKENGRDIMPFYAGDWRELLADSPSGKEAAFRRFYSEERRAERSANCHGVRAKIGSMIHELEKSISQSALAK